MLRTVLHYIDTAAPRRDGRAPDGACHRLVAGPGGDGAGRSGRPPGGWPHPGRHRRHDRGGAGARGAAIGRADPHPVGGHPVGVASPPGASAARTRIMRDDDAPRSIVTVGFADLEGFTSLSQQLPEHELAELVNRFEQLAYDVIAPFPEPAW